ncbi:hypothetical protein ElyMa_004710200 [Elysia marginata]|uniref:Uncharacterized protein n=1 Tax=Elysia marginata TaxID=1093978 RepID=A0AAV4I8M1_9GAST|nr:hypothetical protein ElyMa_004710200 [Elysia marginata]
MKLLSVIKTKMIDKPAIGKLRWFCAQPERRKPKQQVPLSVLGDYQSESDFSPSLFASIPAQSCNYSLVLPLALNSI